MTVPSPLVSVVTGVYNAEDTLERSLRSILSQDLRDVELVVVDDGSTDGTPAILEKLAAGDGRLRVLRQENRGLTAALAEGCHAARGALIARHDADDLSLPGRLSRQAEQLVSEPDLSLVSCFSYVIGPGDELLFEERVAADRRQATQDLKLAGRGPCGHGTALFRTSDYRRVGGYREAFRFAQDWDLWYRLTEIGEFEAVPEFLYAYRFGVQSISASRKSTQEQLRALAMEARDARVGGRTETPALERAAALSSPQKSNAGARRPRSGNYFIGRCLLGRRDRRAIPYLNRAISESPGSLRAWVARAAATFLCTGSGETVAG